MDTDTVIPDVADEMAGGPGLALTAPANPTAELARFNDAVKLYQSLIPASIKATRPQDWVQMGAKVYLQGTGVDRIAPLWGLVFGETTIEREDHPDLNGPDGNPTYSYICTGSAGCRRTGVFFKNIEGTRWSGDKFFWGKGDNDEPLPPDPNDVRKAAFENWKVRAGSMLTGMRNLTPADISAAGVHPGATVNYAAGAKGGKATAVNAAGVATVPWGQKQGTPVTELTDKDLLYYASKAQAVIADPGKAKYRAKEQAWLDAINAELTRREEASFTAESEGEPGARG